MIAAKTAVGSKPSSCSQYPAAKSPRSRNCSSNVCISLEDSANPTKSSTTHSKVSFCFAFLLATSTLVFLQVLFNSGYISEYSPVVCDNGYYDPTGRGNYVMAPHEIASDTARVRFPRTKRRLPQCIIIGARKCGTRALLEFLNLHPMIQKATEEVHFFDDDSKYALGLDWYRRKMPYSFPGQITIEKSPAYFITPTVPDRIYKMNPSIKLLLIVRDPVTRLISDYAQLASNKARKDLSVASFEQLVLRSDNTVNTEYKAVRISIYSMYYRRWIRTFNRSQIHIVDGDNLISDPFSEIQKIETFLGLGHKVQKENFYYNETKGFFCVRNATAEKCLNESKGRKHPEVPQEVVHVLRRFYEPHNQQFYKLCGANFGWPSA